MRRAVFLVALPILLVFSYVGHAADSPSATTQAAPKAKTGTLVGKVVNKSGAAVEKATVYVYIRKPTRDSNLTRVAQGTTKADGTFEIKVDAANDLVVNVMTEDGDGWGKGGFNVKANEKTDMGEIKVGPLQM